VAQEWISLAEKPNRWWITSALESKYYCNKWTYLQQNLMPQGLGTGALYTNNFDSPLTVTGQLWYKPTTVWDFEFSKL
jgi:hypothetical protein